MSIKSRLPVSLAPAIKGKTINVHRNDLGGSESVHSVTITQTCPTVKARPSKSSKVTKVTKVTSRRRQATAPTRHVLDIGRNLSLALTLAAYEIEPNELTVERIGGDDE